MSLKELLTQYSNLSVEDINDYLVQNDPVFSYLGAKIVKITKGEVQLEIPFKKELLRRGGFLNGGMIMTAIDFAGGFAALTVNDGDEQVTQELKVNFLEPMFKGPFKVIGKVIRKGKHTIVVEIDFIDSEGKIGAKALGTWFILRNNLNFSR
ncbi:MAG TPA: PaaI family thioesterase [Geobacterales bacterium]|nr:PaaI family thioesterase [Geobacterales bacterium]